MAIRKIVTLNIVTRRNAVTGRSILTGTLAAAAVAATMGLAPGLSGKAEAHSRWYQHQQRIDRFAPTRGCVWRGRAKRHLARRSVRLVRSYGFRRIYDVDCQHRIYRIKGSAKVYRNGRIRWQRWTRWVNPRSGRIYRYNPVYSAFWR